MLKASPLTERKYIVHNNIQDYLAIVCLCALPEFSFFKKKIISTSLFCPSTPIPIAYESSDQLRMLAG